MEINFSIIIPAYNKATDILATLTSVINQSYAHFEIIIVNDGSTDNSRSVIQSIKDSRVKYFEIENSGVSYARNYGVKLSKYDFLIFLDADDLWKPNHLSNLRNMIEKHPVLNWCGTAYELLHNSRMTLPMKAPQMNFSKGWCEPVDDFFTSSMHDCLAWTSAVCFKKAFFEKLGGFNIEYTTGQDVDLWIRAAIDSKFYFSNTITATYNLQGSNRLTNRPTRTKTYMNPNAFSEYESINLSLKKYLDRIRYSFAIKHKLAGDTNRYSYYRKKIIKRNLTFLQLLFLNLHPILVSLLMSMKIFLESLGFRYRSS